MALAEKIALRAEAEHDWWRAENYWKVKARWHELTGDDDGKRRALVAAAEVHVKEAQDAIGLPNPSYLAASFYIEEAIQAFKKIGGTQKRVDELYRRLLEYQEKGTSEMKPLRINIHLTHEEEQATDEVIKAIREVIIGRSIQEALIALASIGFSPTVDHLKEIAKKIISDTPLTHLVSHELKDERGKVVGRQPSLLEEDPTKNEMFRQALLAHQFQATFLIEPLRQEINAKQRTQPQDLLPIVSNNSFIPRGRESIYARGIHAGLVGDFLVAAHLLIPQIENSIRHLLYQHGIVTSKFNEHDLQNEFDLNTTLTKYHSELATILGKDVAFDLQGLLVERYGSNLRNRLAHGLLDYDDFSVQISYLWWLTLHLCLLGLPISDQDQDDSNDSERPA